MPTLSDIIALWCAACQRAGRHHRAKLPLLLVLLRAPSSNCDMEAETRAAGDSQTGFVSVRQSKRSAADDSITAVMNMAPTCSRMGPPQACMPSVSGSAEAIIITAPTLHIGHLDRLCHQILRRPQRQLRHPFTSTFTPARCRCRSFRCQAAGDSDGPDTAAGPSGDRIRQTLTGLDLLLGIDEEADRRKKAEVGHLAHVAVSGLCVIPTPCGADVRSGFTQRTSRAGYAAG